MIIDFFSLSFKNLKNRSLRTWLTMLGIFIGVSLVVSLVSLGQGMQNAINTQFSTIGVDKILIQPTSPGFGPPGQDSAGNLTDKDLKTIRNVPEVRRVAARMMGSMKIEFNDHSNVNFVISLPDDPDERDLLIEAQDVDIEKGRMLKSGDSRKAIVGSNYAEKNSFEKEIEVGNKISIQGELFEVVGIMKKSGTPFKDDIVLINQDDVEQITGKKDYSLIIAQVHQNADIDKTSEKISKALRRRKGLKEGYEDFEVETSQEMIESFNNILQVVQFFVLGIAAISIIVGGIGIMNTMYTSVLERTRDIGVMKAIGAKNSNILEIFLIESGVIGTIGGGIGLILGICFSIVVEYGAKFALGTNLIEAHFPLSLIIYTLLFSFIVGAISGVLPAMQAAKLKPVEAFRK